MRDVACLNVFSCAVVPVANHEQQLIVVGSYLVHRIGIPSGLMNYQSPVKAIGALKLIVRVVPMTVKRRMLGRQGVVPESADLIIFNLELIGELRSGRYRSLGNSNSSIHIIGI
jgi:hypothetical protein